MQEFVQLQAQFSWFQAAVLCNDKEEKLKTSVERREKFRHNYLYF